MSAMNDLHRRAMDFATQGFMAQMGEEPESAVNFFAEALQLELAAIAELKEPIEPTNSILHRSAGWMAVHCGQLRQAEQLASKALAGNPPEDIADELRELWEQTSFRRHLESNGVALGQSEIQLNLVGRAVADGVVQLSDLIPRMNHIQNLIYRTAQRLRDLPYSSHIPNDIREGYRAFASVPRGGSFTVSLRVGHPTAQLPLLGFTGPSDIIHEVIDLVGLANNDDHDAVEHRIPDPAYQRNFIGLARGLAPDGNRIRQVGFVAAANGDIRSTAITRLASQIRLPGEESSQRNAETLRVSGVLRFADGTGRHANRIRVVEDNGQSHNISVPTGLMDDIVRPMWNSYVTVVGFRRRRQNIINLRDIWQGDPSNPRGVPTGSQANTMI